MTYTTNPPIKLGDFSLSHYQQLPTIEQAREAFQLIDGDTLVTSVFRPLFLKHPMDRTFGFSINHRHFDMTDDEILVDFNGRSAPLSGNAAAGSALKISPAVWYKAANEDVFRPTEFRHASRNDVVMGQREFQFMSEFDNVLREHGAASVLGLCAYPGDDFGTTCEITVGRTNFNLALDDLEDNTSSVETAWFFSAPLWENNRRCFCVTDNGGIHNGLHH